MRSMLPKRGVDVEDRERADRASSASAIGVGPSYHLTLFSCRALTESKQIGQRAHLFSDVLR